MLKLYLMNTLLLVFGSTISSAPGCSSSRTCSSRQATTWLFVQRAVEVGVGRKLLAG